MMQENVEASPSRSVISASEYSINSHAQFPLPFVSNSNSRNLNDELVANKKLEKDNFDMKMKIFYLEEQLQRCEGDGMNANGVNSNDMNELSADNMSLRIKLEESQIELEQRNTLLVKVRKHIPCHSKAVRFLHSSQYHHPHSLWGPNWFFFNPLLRIH